MLLKFPFSTIEYNLFLIIKIFFNQIHDIKVLCGIFSDNLQSQKENIEIINCLLECKILENETTNQITPLILEKIKHFFILNCSIYLNQSLREEALFPVFRKIMEYIKDFNYDLLSVNLDTFLQILKEKKYEILKFIIDKKKIRLVLSENVLLSNNYNDINKTKSFKKSLINNMKIDLEVVILYYISESSDHYIVKFNIFLIVNKIYFLKKIF